jgi:hypothetical protein
MAFTINADDPRTIRALEIAADADKWLKYRDSDGQEAYGVPSQAEVGRRYLVTSSSCDCADFRRNADPAELGPAGEPRACKHILAVRLYRELVRAQAHPSRSTSRPARRGHLSVVPRTPDGGTSTSAG